MIFRRLSTLFKKGLWLASSKKKPTKGGGGSKWEKFFDGYRINIRAKTVHIQFQDWQSSAGPKSEWIMQEPAAIMGGQPQTMKWACIYNVVFFPQRKFMPVESVADEPNVAPILSSSHFQCSRDKRYVGWHKIRTFYVLALKVSLMQMLFPLWQMQSRAFLLIYSGFECVCFYGSFCGQKEQLFFPSAWPPCVVSSQASINFLVVVTRQIHWKGKRSSSGNPNKLSQKLLPQILRRVPRKCVWFDTFMQHLKVP